MDFKPGKNSILSFKGDLLKNLKWAMLVAALWVPGLCIKGENPTSGGETQLKTEPGWDKNVRVLASNRQNLIGYSTYSTSYTRFLTDVLKKPAVRTIEQANDSLVKNGYSVLENDLYPTVTLGEKLGIFNKNAKNKDRFVFVCAQDGNGKYTRHTDRLINELKEIYKIPEENIIRIVTREKKDFLNGIDSISGKINKLSNKENVEVLVYYAGHGKIDTLSAGDKKIEGTLKGEILHKKDVKTGIINSLNELEVKKAFDSKLKSFKTLFILDTCHAGAWISEHI